MLILVMPAVMLASRYRTYQAEAGSTMVLTVVLMMVVVPLAMLVNTLI